MLFDLVILSFAVARISYMLVNEDGPGEIFGRLRRWCGIATHFDTGDRIVVRPNKMAWLGDVLNCVYCCSVWTSIGTWLFYSIAPKTCLVILVPFALSQVALLWLRKQDG